MDFNRYGPFANVVFLASALVATFSLLLLKSVGKVARWTWLGSTSPAFLVTVAARVVAVGLMAVTYFTIDKSNFKWFGAAAVMSGVLAFVAIWIFEYNRKLHVISVPAVGPNGKPLTDKKKKTVVNSIVIGLESNMRPDAQNAFSAAQKKYGGLSLAAFMSGYGSTQLNDPEAIWDRQLLAAISSRLTATLMSILLLSTMALFWAAFAIEAAIR